MYGGGSAAAVVVACFTPVGLGLRFEQECGTRDGSLDPGSGRTVVDQAALCGRVGLSVSGGFPGRNTSPWSDHVRPGRRVPLRTRV